jgi:hypothetical protein
VLEGEHVPVGGESPVDCEKRRVSSGSEVSEKLDSRGECSVSCHLSPSVCLVTIVSI